MNKRWYSNNISWSSSSTNSTTDYYPVTTQVIRYVPPPEYEPATYFDPEKEKEDKAKHVRAAFRWLDKRVSEIVDRGEILTMKTAVSL